MDAIVVVVNVVGKILKIQNTQNPFENVIDPVFQIVQVTGFHVVSPHPMNR